MVVPQLQFVRLQGDTSLLQQFLEGAGSSLESFRYFNARPLDVIANHVVTAILVKDGNPVAYGHLDKEGETVWLGIAVAENQKRQGLGNAMMEFLLSSARELDLTVIHLSVDNDNTGARSLYRKFGFTDLGAVNERSLKMECRLNG